jgi:single-strand DNA-binding protein
MVTVNTVFLGGHLGGPPEEKRLPSGKLLCTFRMATNRWDARGEAEVADWHTVLVWERQAEQCIKYLRKGSPVLVEGRISMRQWDSSDGKKHTSAEIVASRVSFLGSGRSPSPGDAPSEAAPAEAARAPFTADSVPF